MVGPGNGSRRGRKGSGFTRMLAAGRVPQPRFPRLRLLALAGLLVLTIAAIRALQRSIPPELVTVRIRPFAAAAAGPADPRLEELTDRVASRVSALSRVRMVVLDRGGGEDPSATWHLSGTAAFEGEELRIEVRLRPIGAGGAPAQREARGRADRLDALADEIAAWVGEHL